MRFRAELSSTFGFYAQQENDETEQDQFESNIQVDTCANEDHECDGNIQPYPAFTCSKLTIETLEQGKEYVQS